MKTITIISKDYTGLMADVTELLTAKQINISSITAELIDTDAFIRLQTEQRTDALKILTEAGFNAVSQDSVIVRIADTPGALAKISRTLAENGIDIRGINMIQQNEGFNVVAISSNQEDKTRDILKEMLVN